MCFPTSQARPHSTKKNLDPPHAPGKASGPRMRGRAPRARASAPADALDRGPWWELFGDAELNWLAEQVQLSNQNIAAAVAAYAQAQAVVRLQPRALLPSVSLSGGATLSGGAGTSRSGTTTQASLGVDWAPDLWGRLESGVNNAQASAQASEADLASARLSAVRSLQIARNRYSAGVVAQTDVLQAQTQLANARADLATARQNRARFEHALAVLTGQAPSAFVVPSAPWVAQVPEVPPGVPSTLLQRRPDIASAERAVAAANAQIGIQRAAYFPSLSLGATLGSGGSSVADLFKASGTVWSLGLSIAQTVFDAGATAARVEEAQAARDARVAVYRQTVLTAFQSVEDQLTVLRTLREQEPLLQLQVNRQLAVVALVQALGGGWQAPWQPPA